MACQDISAEALAALIAPRPQRVCIIDVRERWEFTNIHIRGSVVIPLGHFPRRAELALPDKLAKVILVSAGDARASIAAQFLKSRGYHDIARLVGGTDDWSSANLEIETGWGVPGKRIGEKIAREVGDLEISSEDLIAQTGRALIIDIRPAWEYKQGHIPGAINVPGEELAARVEEIRDHANRQGYKCIVTHCAGRTRGLLAAARLRSGGLPFTFALRNGCMGWMLSGEKLETVLRPTPFATNDRQQTFDRFAGERISLSALESVQTAGSPHYLLDLRNREKFEAGHIAGAISLGVGQLALEADLWLAQPWVPVILMAENGLQGQWAADILTAMGLATVLLLDARPADWAASSVSREEEAKSYSNDVAGTTVAISDPIGISAENCIDVRSLGEWSLCHVPGSSCVPIGALHDHCDEISLLNGGITLVSSRGVRAKDAAAILVNNGIDPARITIMAGGVLEWIDAGGETITDEPDMRFVTKDSGGRLSEAVWAMPFDSALRPAMTAYLAWEEALED